MTTFNKSTLQNLWINGFVPQGSDYTNLIQSQVNIAETALQAMAGALSVTELNTPLVSATGGHFTTVSSTTLRVNTLTVSGGGAMTIHAGGAAFFTSDGTFNVSALGNTTINSNVNRTDNITTNFTTNVGGTCNVSGQSSVNITAGTSFNLAAGTAVTVGGTSVTLNAPTLVSGSFKRNTAIVSAAGTAQATGAAISATIGVTRLMGTTDGQTTGFLLPSPSGNSGIEQILVHEGAVSGNLWPSVGCKINGLGANAAFALAANTPYYVIYATPSAYAVK